MHSHSSCMCRSKEKKTGSAQEMRIGQLLSSTQVYMSYSTICIVLKLDREVRIITKCAYLRAA